MLANAGFENSYGMRDVQDDYQDDDDDGWDGDGDAADGEGEGDGEGRGGRGTGRPAAGAMAPLGMERREETGTVFDMVIDRMDPVRVEHSLLDGGGGAAAQLAAQLAAAQLAAGKRGWRRPARRRGGTGDGTRLPRARRWRPGRAYPKP